MAVSSKPVRALLWPRWGWILTQDLMENACLQLLKSHTCTGAAWGHMFRAQSRPVTPQLQTTHTHSHSTTSPVYETVLKTNRRTESTNTQAHSFQGSVYVVIDGVICGQRENGDAEKTAVCLLQLNMQQHWGTVRERPGGLSGV